MRLILTQEVTGLGSPGDVIEVKDGYGRNYLVPRGYAMKATKGAEKEVAALRRARETRDIRDLDQARQVASQLASLPVRLTVRAGEGGRLFGSVTPADITQAVVAAGGPQLDRRRLELDPIKTVGSHRVTARLHPDVEATMTVEVVPAR